MKLTFKKFSLFNILINKDKIKTIHWVLGFHAFGIMLLLIFSGIILGIIIFYTYVVLIQEKEQAISAGTVKFEYKKYQDIVQIWKAREQKLQELNKVNISNPFK